ncbi:hypothetical protein [Streptomyces sp. NPDC086023]|uniref:hypothetical protein n=1 Tax=Streptomyces sp. NPDC086023 TaxID=3365746 RepID=UPI0037D1D2F2
MRRAQHVVAALFIDMDHRPPRARYECLICGFREVVEGRDRVKGLVSHIRTTHRAACAATTQGAHAA